VRPAVTFPLPLLSTPDFLYSNTLDHVLAYIFLLFASFQVWLQAASFVSFLAGILVALRYLSLGVYLLGLGWDSRWGLFTVALIAKQGDGALSGGER